MKYYELHKRSYGMRRGKEKDVKAFLGMVMSEKWKEQEQLVCEVEQEGKQSKVTGDDTGNNLK